MTTATAGVLRVLGPRDLPQVRALLARDPVKHCFVASRVNAGGLDTWRMGGELWGWTEDGELTSALYLGANLVPVETTPEARRAFADRCRRIGRRCSSIVGPSEDVSVLWGMLADSWGPAREIRGDQPVMVIEREAAVRVPADPLVRRVREDEIDILMPACVAMFTEEVGVSPLAGGGAEPYRARIAELVRAGRAFARIERGRVVTKAEIGAVGDGVCQVQGVWTAPELRGQGLGLAAMAQIVHLARDISPTVSLYVNDFNVVARHVYERVGFTQSATFSTVLF
ncbi:MAG: GNAT family N-acetyltransferase [Candidatus Nanopelagicales bacterium]